MKLIDKIFQLLSLNEFPPHIRRTVAAIYVSILFSVSAHFFFLVVFAIYGQTFLAFFNIGSVLAFVLAYFLVQRNRIITAIVCGALEIVIHSTLASLILGWEVGFGWYFLPLSMSTFIMLPGKLYYKAMAPLALFGLFAFLWEFTTTHGPLGEPLSSLPTAILKYNNVGGTFLVCSLLTYYYSSTARKSEAMLQNQIDAVRALKEQQDADYYLTSLLLRPLHIAEYTRPNVHISFLTKQKKEFIFKNQVHEIGGDLSFADSINLRGTQYTVFYNGDAMGKSLQGAGGAIVFGSILNARINRSKTAKAIQGQSPGMWLKQTYGELQNSFVVFEHAMFVSMILGLLDEQTGKVYMLNAEHPAPVLLRGGEARLVGSDCILSKVGSPLPSQEIKMLSLTLRPGDMLFAGSDGRDDIIDPDSGQMNEDEYAFLRHIQESQGELSSIYASLVSVGEVTDDISLLRLHYHLNGSAT